MNEDQLDMFPAEQQAAQEEAYYWHVLHEFKVITNVFGVKKVLEDLKSIDLNKSIEQIVEENRKEIPKLLIPDAR